MKILMLCSPQGIQKALSHKINNLVGLDGLIIVQGIQNRNISIFKLILRLWQRFSTVLTFFIFRRAWFNMLRHYNSRFNDFCISPNLFCDDVNDSAVASFISDFKPDLVVVSGTNLLKEPLINEIHKHGKVINLHTGISPYIKGGPNCTNWCLFLREFNLIGNTVMWLDKGIDSGNIITTEMTPLTGEESLLDLHIKVMDHAHMLYTESIRRFSKGVILPDISQNDFEIKRLFLSKQWGLFQMLIALFNFYVYYHKGSKYLIISDSVRLIKLSNSI